jgi:hypothetical protein
MFLGLASATDFNNYLMIYHFCSQHFSTLLRLLQTYVESLEMANTFLVFFNVFVEHQVTSYYDERDTILFFSHSP